MRHGPKDACEGFSPKDVAKACAEAGLLDAVLESGKLGFQKNVKVPGRGTERFYLITGRELEAFRQRQWANPATAPVHTAVTLFADRHDVSLHDPWTQVPE